MYEPVIPPEVLTQIPRKCPRADEYCSEDWEDACYCESVCLMTRTHVQEKALGRIVTEVIIRICDMGQASWYVFVLTIRCYAHAGPAEDLLETTYLRVWKSLCVLRN